MDEIGVTARINELCRARGWSYYKLAKESEIPYSTLNTMLHKSFVPTIPSLVKICNGFGISLAQFFSEHDESAMLTEEQKEWLALLGKLNLHNRELAVAYIQGLFDCQKKEG